MWGKKTAIVIDEDFFNQLGKMKPANDMHELRSSMVRGAVRRDGKRIRPAAERRAIHD
jgi:hypothetical protein